MARTDLTVTPINRSGVDLTAILEAFNADGEKVLNGGDVFVVVYNGSGGTRTVTVTTPRTVDGLAVADLTATVDTTDYLLLGPFPTDTFNNSDGKVYVDVDSETSVTVGAFRLER